MANLFAWSDRQERDAVVREALGGEFDLKNLSDEDLRELRRIGLKAKVEGEEQPLN